MDAFDSAFNRHHGHLTVNDVFRADEMDSVVRDIEQWGESFLEAFPAEQRSWYNDGGVSVYFSQIFFKPPEGGGPKPAHQDNVYFGPADPEGSIPEAIFLSDRVFVMTERPGRFAAVYDIDLPRPRPLDVMGTEPFAAYARTLRAHFFAQGNLDAH